MGTISGGLTGLTQPSALTFDAAGHLWVTNFANSSLTEYAAGRFGDVQPLATVEGSLTGLNAPEGVTFDSAGNLLVSNPFGASLTEYPVTATGNASPTRTISGPATGLALPAKVDVDANGNIYVANELGAVEKFGASASGNQAPLAAIAGAATGLSAPTGLAVAPPLSVATKRLSAARVGHRYRQLLKADLGTTPYRWSMAKGELPPGLKLHPSGQLTGVPRTAKVYRFTVRVRDRSRPRMTATRALKLVVRRR